MRCNACMAVNPAANRFCGACGAKLVPTGGGAHEEAGPEGVARWGELKLATVLFADIVSSTELIAGLDPEQAMNRLQPALQQMCEAVETYGGTVVRTLGDGIMAMFGVPVALEGHARLACEAALAMQKAFGQPGAGWRIRVGLHSGPIAWDPANADGVRGGGVHGLTIHLASRVMASAEPGGTWLTQACLDLVRPDCDAEPVGAHAMKGIAQPLPLYRLTGVQPFVRVPQSGQNSLTSFRGRDRELGGLQSALRLTAQGYAQVVGVSGEPGSGKSRICFEFARECRAAQVPVTEVRAQLYGRATPLQPVLELLRTFFFGIVAGDDTAAARARVTGRLGSSGPGADADTALVCDFIGLAQDGDLESQLSPQGRHARLLAMVGELCRRRADVLAVLLIEDLHWLDESSGEFVSALVNAVAGTRTLVVLNYRRTYQPPWEHVSHFSQLELGELSTADTHAMVQELTGSRPELREICQMVVRRSGGNPFFAEELVRSLSESGVLSGDGARSGGSLVAIERELPSTVQAVVASRIDHLGGAQKTLLQICAIIGKEVPLAVLEQVAGTSAQEVARSLGTLRQAALIQEQPEAAGRLVAFRHPLIQEVAYSTQLKARRAPIHASVARAMESHYHDQLNEYAGLIAHHFESADLALDAAGYLARAAQWVGSTDSALAIKHWHKVRMLLAGQLEGGAGAVLRGRASGQISLLGWREGLSYQQVQPFLEEAMALAGTTDRRLIQVLLVVEGRMLQAGGSPSDLYVERVQRALELAHTDGDVGRIAILNVALSQAYGWAGLLNEALAAADIGLQGLASIHKSDRDFVGFSVEHWLFGMRGRLLTRMGRFEEAAVCLRQLETIGEFTADPIVLQIIHQAWVDLALSSGNAAMAQEHATRMTELDNRHSIPYLRAASHNCRGMASSVSRDFHGALREFSAALEMVRNSNVAREHETDILTNLAECHRRADNPGQALDFAREAIDTARARTTRLAECRALIVLAAALLDAHGAREAVAASEALDAAHALVELTGAAIYREALQVERARLHAARGVAQLAQA